MEAEQIDNWHGGLQVIGTTKFISLLAIAFGLPWQQAVVMGMILSLSSTAIVLQTLNEKGLMTTAAGQSSFSVFTFPGCGSYTNACIISFAGNRAGSTGNSAFKKPGRWVGSLATTLTVFAAVVIIIMRGRFLVRSIFQLVAATSLRELFTATALLFVIGIAVSMSQVGLRPALITFLVGVVLANSEYKHELESDIEPFKGLLLGLFFIEVVASINFSLINHQPILILSLVVQLMLVKSLVFFSLVWFSAYIRSEHLFSLVLRQVGEFAFVLFSHSSQDGILPQSIIDVMIAVLAISMALTPPLLVLNERIIQLRFGFCRPVDTKEADKINEFNPVIIAGFSHFGSTVGHFLRAHKIGMTVLDNDSDRVELLRKMGFKVYYDDASRYDLFQSARAKLIVTTIEPAEKLMKPI